jgi:CelD/BcsL family acetyltransferase involved in cellulose biosynthesis
MRLAVEEVGAAELPALRGDWEALFAVSRAGPFLSWEWCTSYARHLLGTRRARILVARENGRAVGLLPLAVEEVRPFGLPVPVRRLGFLPERFGGADYLDVLAPAGREHGVGARLFAHLAATGGFDFLDLDGLAADSPSLPLLLHRFAEGWVFRLEPRHVCPAVVLGSDFRRLVRESGRGENFRRRERRLREDPGYEFRVVAEPARAAGAFDRFLALHDRRWREEGGSDALGRPAVRAFHREVVVRLAEAGRLRFEELWSEGGCRASIYGIVCGERFHFYQSGYDPAWAARSVGLVALGRSLEAAVGAGLRRYDFLRGAEPYKLGWANDARHTVAVRIAARGLPAWLFRSREEAERAARAAARRWLPGEAVRELRRRRRRREARG